MQDGERNVRRASASDAGVLARLLYEFNTEFDTETDSESVLKTRFARILTDDSVIALLSADGRQTTGFALITLRPAIWFDGPVATLDELYVVPARRGAGFGTALLSRARDVLRERGCPEMHINVDEVDVDTRRFYERHGFMNIEPGAGYRMLCYVGSTELP
ncbi:GNAT family N-acetyltransferase [Catenuloplanes indicus]|uniref:GNAT superfamily N-acetyltransferase n=1 Tax=Catenuloplanes indicus TaxID=137267 RepID=A0AAE3VUB8_9ACTN|nr:GNAT family N-acetyltransferase [Catenuloplanes indicus]MDQ0363981.1 GNAT superfamily N-acetyltransferase [Catenuloplanes indicus]